MTDKATASYRDREEWLEERKTGIGGSDAAAVLGFHPYKSALDVWREKTGQAVDEVKLSGPILRGLHLEPVAADLYVEQTGREIRRQPMRRHPEHDFMLGNVDRQIFAGTGEGEFRRETTGILEIKCPGLRVMANAKAHGLPDYMTIQLMHYLAVYGYEWGSFALFNAENWQLVHFDLEADAELIENLIEQETAFWNDYVLTGEQPPTESTGTIDVPEVAGELTVMEGERWHNLADEMREARELKDAAKDLENHAKEQIQEMMKREEVHAVEVPGVARFYYKPMKGRTSWKKTAQAIARETGVEVESFIVKGNSYERFTPYFYESEE